MFASNPKKRRAITIETKYAIIQQHNKGSKRVELQKEYQLSSSTVSTILANKKKNHRALRY